MCQIVSGFETSTTAIHIAINCPRSLYFKGSTILEVLNTAPSERSMFWFEMLVHNAYKSVHPTCCMRTPILP